MGGVPKVNFNQSGISGIDLLTDDIKDVESFAETEALQRLVAIMKQPGVIANNITDDILLPKQSAPYTIQLSAGVAYSGSGGRAALSSPYTLPVISGADVGKYVRIQNLLIDDPTSQRQHPVTGQQFYTRKILDTTPADIVDLNTTQPVSGASDYIWLGKITAVDGGGNITFDLTSASRQLFQVFGGAMLNLLTQLIVALPSQTQVNQLQDIVVTRYAALIALLDQELLHGKLLFVQDNAVSAPPAPRNIKETVIAKQSEDTIKQLRADWIAKSQTLSSINSQIDVVQKYISDLNTALGNTGTN